MALSDLRTTPLDALHRSLGGRMVAFAGWSLPVQFPAGTLAEHAQARSRAALFDVSHMGQVSLHGDGSAAALEALVRQRVSEGDPIALRMVAEERWDVIPGAEATAALNERVSRSLTAIAARHPDQFVAVVTHGGVIAALLSIATASRPFAFTGADNASISHLVITEDRWVVRRFNDTSHLSAGFSGAARPPT